MNRGELCFMQNTYGYLPTPPPPAPSFFHVAAVNLPYKSLLKITFVVSSHTANLFTKSNMLVKNSFI